MASTFPAALSPDPDGHGLLRGSIDSAVKQVIGERALEILDEFPDDISLDHFPGEFSLAFDYPMDELEQRRWARGEKREKVRRAACDGLDAAFDRVRAGLPDSDQQIPETFITLDDDRFGFSYFGPPDSTDQFEVTYFFDLWVRMPGFQRRPYSTKAPPASPDQILFG